MNIEAADRPRPCRTTTCSFSVIPAYVGIELWIEGRRLGDFRRWAALNRPGTAEDMTGRDLCFPIPLTERETSPNL